MILKVAVNKSGEAGLKEWTDLQQEDPDLLKHPFLGHLVWIEWYESEQDIIDFVPEYGAFATGATYKEAFDKALKLGQRVWDIPEQKFWTDYPFTELGDTPGEEAPVREITILRYDGNKYCDVHVDGIESNIKFGYIYMEKGRAGAVPIITLTTLDTYKG